jgi:hypothetical protein
VECDAGQPVAAVAESLSSMAAGDLLGPEGGDGAGARFLEFILEREETDVEVSAVDARDEGLYGFERDIVAPQRDLISSISNFTELFFANGFTFI